MLPGVPVFCLSDSTSDAGRICEGTQSTSNRSQKPMDVFFLFPDSSDSVHLTDSLGTVPPNRGNRKRWQFCLRSWLRLLDRIEYWWSERVSTASHNLTIPYNTPKTSNTWTRHEKQQCFAAKLFGICVYCKNRVIDNLKPQWKRLSGYVRQRNRL